MDKLNKHAPFLALLAITLFGILSLHLAATDSLTFDERAHIPAGYSYVRYGDIRLNPEHPPLLKDLSGLPLLFVQPQFPLASEEWQNGPNEQWEIGSMFLHCTRPLLACNDPWVLTFLARLPLILLSLVAALFLFWWGRKMAGPVAGLIALLFFVADPNIIAHNHLVTTDVGIGIFLCFAIYFFLNFLKAPTWKNVFLAALFFSLVQLVKFSAVLLFPLFFIATFLYALVRPIPAGYKGGRWRLLGSYFGKSLSILFLYALIVYLVYYFHTLSTPTEHLVAIAYQMFPDRELGPLARSIVEYTSSISFLKPYAAYLLGVLMVFGRVAGGNTHYFLGTVQSDAQAAYFPVVFLAKETLPFLILLAITLFYSLIRFTRNILSPDPHQDNRFRARFVRHIDSFVIFSFVILYSVLSIFGNLNIGFRHLFPILPFLFLWVAKTILTILRDVRIPQFVKSGFGVLVVVLMAVQILIPFLQYPNYLSYYNELAGGTQEGYKIATDSNYDWGQDLGRLRHFIHNHNRCTDPSLVTTFNCNHFLPDLPAIQKIRVDYFGGESPSLTLGGVYEGWWSERPPESGWYAISINTLQEQWVTGESHPEDENKNYLWLQKYTPIARAGQSIFIYYIP